MEAVGAGRRSQPGHRTQGSRHSRKSVQQEEPAVARVVLRDSEQSRTRRDGHHHEPVPKAGLMARCHEHHSHALVGRAAMGQERQLAVVPTVVNPRQRGRRYMNPLDRSCPVRLRCDLLDRCHLGCQKVLA